MNDPLSEQRRLIGRLQDPDLYDHPVTGFEVVETHISWVLLTGRYAYKIKKAVNFGFLDFSTLEKRHLYCEEELRLNRRLARQLYVAVVSITDAKERLELSGVGPVVEYAVKMVQFPQDAQLDSLSAGDGVDSGLMDDLANMVAKFHLSVDSATVDSELGGVEQVQRAVLENFEHLRQCIEHPAVVPLLDRLEQWSRTQLQLLASLVSQRKAQGFVRECHGDMHLRNMALWNDEIIIFDCIEFNKNLYFIDVISEIAFLIMDLEARGKAALAQRFLNRYIEVTGDYGGLRILRFYKVYRALVRAKVDILRAGQEEPDSRKYREIFDDFLNYLHLAENYSEVNSPFLLINHGLSGSGKSTIAWRLAESLPAIMVRSDVERKRLFAGETRKRGGTIEKGIYQPEATRRVYLHLVEIAKILLTAGYTVMIDATNLKLQQRKQFIDLARLQNVACCIVSYRASLETLRERVHKRNHEGSDVSDATEDILSHQLATCEPLSEEEKLRTLEIDTEMIVDLETIIRNIQILTKDRTT